MLETSQDPATLVNRVLVASLASELHDIRGRQTELPDVYHKSSYAHSQEFGRNLKMEKSWGIAYSSVRHDGGECFAVMRPPALSRCHSEKHLGYVWDGNRIRQAFEMDIYF